VADLSGVKLSLMIGPGVPVPALKPVVEALESVQVTTSAGARSGYQVAFVYSKTSPIAKTLLPAGYFDPLVRVIVVATLNGVPHVLADGPITRQDVAPATQPGTAKLTITGEDISGYMDLADLSGLPYPGIPDAGCVLIALAKYAVFGVIPLVIPPISFDAPLPTQRYKQHEGTDFAYVSKLAKEAGYVFYIEPGPAPGANIAYFGPQIRVGIPQSALSVDFDAATNVEQISFSYDSNSATLPIAYVRLPGVKVPVPFPVPNINPLRPPLTARPFVPRRTRPIATERLGAADVVKQAIAALSEGDAVTGTGSLNVAVYGKPLKARSLVGVRGAGLTYDGLYYVKSVTDSLSRGSWKQSFQLGRDGAVANIPVVPT
jgi:hypothetical protein